MCSISSKPSPLTPEQWSRVTRLSLNLYTVSLKYCDATRLTLWSFCSNLTWHSGNENLCVSVNMHYEHSYHIWVQRLFWQLQQGYITSSTRWQEVMKITSKKKEITVWNKYTLHCFNAPTCKRNKGPKRSAIAKSLNGSMQASSKFYKLISL